MGSESRVQAYTYSVSRPLTSARNPSLAPEVHGVNHSFVNSRAERAGSSVEAMTLQRATQGQRPSSLCQPTILSSRNRRRERRTLGRGEIALEEGFNFQWTEYLPPKNHFSPERMEIVKKKSQERKLSKPCCQCKQGHCTRWAQWRKIKMHFLIFYLCTCDSYVWILTPLQIHELFSYQYVKRKKCFPLQKLKAMITRLCLKSRKSSHSIYGLFIMGSPFNARLLPYTMQWAGSVSSD